jgi:acyl-CoA synthetase (AMP-forming)/AMP-acid ligase II
VVRVSIHSAAAPIGVRAQESPHEAAVVDRDGTLTWDLVAWAVDRAAGRLAAVATRPGDRWAVLGDNVAPTLLAHAAGLVAGVGTVAVSRQLTATELAYQFTDAGVVAAVTGAAGLPAVLEAAERTQLRLVVVHGDAAPPDPAVPVPPPASVQLVTWDAWLAAEHPAAEPTADDRPAAPPLVYTSGTTGRPRATEVRWVAGAHATAAGYLRALVDESHTPAGAHLVAGPLQHNAPLTAVRHLLTGQPVVVLERFDAEQALVAIDRHRVSSSVMVPTHFQRLLALPPEVRDRYDVSSLRLVAHTGSACPPAVKRAMIDWFGPVLVESYGGSEVGTLCRIGVTDWLARPGSVGRPVPPFEVLVLDADGAPVPAGATGLLCFRAPPERGIRYLHDAEKTAAAYVADGVLTLGDVGHVDEDGFVHITDRAADVVVSGGVNLYPAESERVLATHPGVADVAVIGVPDADLGEQLLALVVPARATDPPASPDLEAWCRRTLASYKCPKRYELVPDLPRNAMNKLDKPAMRRPYWPTGRTVAG